MGFSQGSELGGVWKGERPLSRFFFGLKTHWSMDRPKIPFQLFLGGTQKKPWSGWKTTSLGTFSLQPLVFGGHILSLLVHDRWYHQNPCTWGSHTAGLVAWNTTVAAAAGAFGSYLYLYGFWEGKVEEGRGGRSSGTASGWKVLCRKRTPWHHVYHWHHPFQRHIILSQTCLKTMWIEGISSTLQAWHWLGNTKHQQRSTPPEKDPSTSDLSTERRTLNRFNVCSANT